MPQKLLFFDLDGTLLTSDKTITEYTLHVIRSGTLNDTACDAEEEQGVPW